MRWMVGIFSSIILMRLKGFKVFKSFVGERLFWSGMDLDSRILW